MTEDEMVGWHHRPKGQAFEQTLGVGDGQGGLACCRRWGCKELNMNEQLNNKKVMENLTDAYFNNAGAETRDSWVKC